RPPEPPQGSAEAGPAGAPRRWEHDWDNRCRALCGERRFGSACENDIDLEPDELGRDLGKALAASFPPTVLDCNGATLDPAEFPQSLYKCGCPCALSFRRAADEVADGRQLARLLRARRERPGSGSAAEKRDEIAPLHSITSSGIASRVFGMAMPSALGVLRLTTSSNLVGCTTGISAGFSPLRTRPT